MTETERILAGVQDLADERDSLRREVRRLRRLIDADRTGLADGLGKVLQLVERYDWIRQGHWGSIEVEERTVETMRLDFTKCLDAIEDISSRSLRESGERAFSAFKDVPSIPFKLEPS